MDWKFNKKDEQKWQYIFSLLEKLDYGSILITVHAGEITQVDVTEKRRFPLQKLPKTTK